ncbi:MAG: YceI family protein [Anaerolineales bacterium]|nr:YceI family protein [Chloroflexota bacterium]MBL6983563.1 YceI family protein [Anaerolineales bacterium]
MSKKAIIGIGTLVVLMVFAAACTPQSPEETSATAEAPEAVIVATEVVEEMAEPEEDAEHSEEMSEESSEADVESGDEEVMDESGAAGVVAFEIVQAESEARFSLGELLRGNPKTVVGVTDQVTGDFQVDFDNPTNSQVGVIQINADTLSTDNNFRNGAIQKFILDTSQYEFIIFTPTSYAGLPESVDFGEAVSFMITGDLTIRDLTNQVTFEATVTPVSETRLEGYASTIIARADYNLTIPEVQQVAEVDEEVLLEIEFVAALTDN